jgi:uncharacterized protein (TIRG00374 family)
MRFPSRAQLRIISCLFVGALLFLLLRHLDLRQFLRSLRTADWKQVALAALLILTVNTAARVKRFQAMLRPLPATRPIRFWEMTGLLLTTRTLSSLLPARAGEALRTVQLNRRHGYPVPGIIAALVLEPLAETLSITLPALAMLIFVHPPSFVVKSLYVVAFAGSLGVFFAVLMAESRARREMGQPPVQKAQPRGWLQRWLARLVESIHLLNDPKIWVRGVIWSLLADASDLLSIGLCLAAVGVQLDLASWFVIFVMVNVAIAVPATPGNLGTLEAGAMLALGALGVERSQALAFALLYHASHLVPTVLAGSVALQLQWREDTADEPLGLRDMAPRARK